MPFQNLIEPYTLTIASSGSLSGSVYLNGNGIIGLANAGTWTASVMTFRVSLGSIDPNSGGTWVNAYDSTGELSVPASVLGGTQYIALNPQAFPSVYWLQLRSGQASGGTVQGAARAWTVFTRPLT